MAIGQFYHVGVDSRRNYRVYGGLQDNGSWGGPSRSRHGAGPINEDWFRVGGGDGFICLTDPDDPDQIYFESQNGSMGRLNLRTGERGFIRPRGRRGPGGPAGQSRPSGQRQRPRFNWKTPFILSHHNSRIHYSAGNFVYRSLNRGENVRKISPEITRTKRGAATALAQSHHDPDVIYVGTNDGVMWVTRNSGHDWEPVISFPDDEPSDDEKDQNDADRATKDKTEEQAAPGESRGRADRPDAPRSGRRGGRRGRGRMLERLKGFDANKDGKIQRDEVPERMARFFDRMDGNGDGVIDEDELKAMAARRGGRPPRQRPDAEPAKKPAEKKEPEAKEESSPKPKPPSKDDPPVTPQEPPAKKSDDPPAASPDVGGNGHNGDQHAARSQGSSQEDPKPQDPAKEQPKSETKPDEDNPPKDEVQQSDKPDEPKPDQEAPAKQDKPAASPEPKPADEPSAEKSEEQPSEDTSKGESKEAAPTDDPISGEWAAQMLIEGMPEGEGDFTMVLTLAPDGKVTGSYSSRRGEGDSVAGKFDPKTGRLTITFDSGQFMLDFTATVSGSTMTGDVDVGEGMFGFEFRAQRTKAAVASAATPSAQAEEKTDEPEDDGTKPLTELLPGPRWVSSIETSRTKQGRVYVTLDGHRSNDDEPYVFVSQNVGKTWRSIRANLPKSAGTTRVIREDIENPDILYLGAEFSAWVSIDRGQSWSKFGGDLPTVAVHELAVHPSAGEIVAATHGRSLWVLDVTPLRQMSQEVVSKPVHLYKPQTAIYWRSEPSRGGPGGARRFVGQNPSSGAQVYYSLAKDVGQIEMKITDHAGKTIREIECLAEAGLHRIGWDLRRAPEARPSRGRFATRAGRRGFRGRRGRLVPSGVYHVVLIADGETFTQDLTVETDPEYHDYRPWERDEELEFELDQEYAEDQPIDPGDI